MLIKIAEKEYNETELAVLSKAGVLQIGQKNDPASTTLTATPLHGPFHGNANQFGIFSDGTVRPGRFSTLARPDQLIGNLSLTKSDYTNEILEVMTGQTADTGTNATGFCGNPPTVGQLKTCRQTFAWGDYYIKTELTAAALTGQRRNYADVPVEILNMGPRPNNFFPDVMYRLDDTRSEFRHQLFKVGVSLERQTEQVLIQGTAGTANNAYIGWFTQFGGLSGQVATGKTDSVTSIVCPALDSTVVSWNTNIDGTIADGSSRDIVEVTSDMVRGKWVTADRLGFGRSSITWAFLMRYETFASLVDAWACNYATYKCAGVQYSENNRDAFAVNQLRLQMMNGQYLLVDGIQVPVIFTEGIPQETLGNNYYKADIFFGALNWSGMPLARLEYFPMDNGYVSEYFNAFGIKTVDSLNNGLFLVGHRDTGLCLEWHFQARMRLVLETAFLWGRIDDVWYRFYDPIRNALPGASNYYDGGLTHRL